MKRTFVQSFGEFLFGQSSAEEIDEPPKKKKVLKFEEAHIDTAALFPENGCLVCIRNSEFVSPKFKNESMICVQLTNGFIFSLHHKFIDQFVANNCNSNSKDYLIEFIDDMYQICKNQIPNTEEEEPTAIPNEFLIKYNMNYDKVGSNEHTNKKNNGLLLQNYLWTNVCCGNDFGPKYLASTLISFLLKERKPENQNDISGINNQSMLQLCTQVQSYHNEIMNNNRATPWPQYRYLFTLDEWIDMTNKFIDKSSYYQNCDQNKKYVILKLRDHLMKCINLLKNDIITSYHLQSGSERHQVWRLQNTDNDHNNVIYDNFNENEGGTYYYIPNCDGILCWGNHESSKISKLISNNVKCMNGLSHLCNIIGDYCGGKLIGIEKLFTCFQEFFVKQTSNN